MLQRTLPAGFIAPCLSTKATQLPSGGRWLHEIKYDGFRIIARKKCAQFPCHCLPPAWSDGKGKTHCTRRQRPSCRRAAEQRNELSTLGRSIAVMRLGSKRARRREHYLIEIERGIAPASRQSISPPELPERFPL
jgi:hypothetical protein